MIGQKSFSFFIYQTNTLLHRPENSINDLALRMVNALLINHRPYIEWCKRRVTCQQLIGDNKHM